MDPMVKYINKLIPKKFSSIIQLHNIVHFVILLGYMIYSTLFLANSVAYINCFKNAYHILLSLDIFIISIYESHSSLKPNASK